MRAPSTPPIPLDTHELHVWQAPLSSGASYLGRASRLLSTDEQRRAERFHHERDRTSFVLAHGVLRELLGAYTGQAPESLVFHSGPHGKPYIPGFPLHFNLSHSGQRALYAVARTSRVGVDIEHIRPLDELESIARRVLSSRELEVLRAASPATRLALFFRLWTRKESVLKGLGRGLGAPVQAVDVVDDTVRIFSTGETDLAGADGTEQWTVRSIPLDPQYAAAVAMDRHDLQLVYRDWRRIQHQY